MIMMSLKTRILTFPVHMAQFLSVPALFIIRVKRLEEKAVEVTVKNLKEPLEQTCVGLDKFGWKSFWFNLKRLSNVF